MKNNPKIRVSPIPSVPGIMSAMARIKKSARIDPFLVDIGKVWRKYPYLRFGQLVYHLAYCLDRKEADIFYLEDKDFRRAMKKIDKFVKGLTKT